MRCILFDLDGTLITTGGAGRRALEKAFQSLYGIVGAMQEVNPAGKTDPKIIREIFAKHFHRDCSDREMQTVQEEYLNFLRNECEQAEGYCVREGIPVLLEELHKRKMLVGLGTGNLEKGARIKLERSGLNPALRFGGFGSDSENRTEILQIAHQRAEKLAGHPVPRENVYIVGDTELDILAAREANYKVIAVSTGHSSAKVLLQHRPDFFLSDFKDTEHFLKIVYNITKSSNHK